MKAKIPEQKAEGSLQLSLLDLNKQLIAQLPALDIEEAKRTLQIFETENAEIAYFMLLSRDISYYTVFAIDRCAKENFTDVVIECLQNWGTIKSIDKEDIKDDRSCSLDCWVQQEDGTVILFKLFDYDWGVIECQ